jgi:hypothetical protein
MADALKTFLSGGGKILDDSKKPGAKKDDKKPKPLGSLPPADPHHAFIARCIQDKPKKSDIVEQMKKFIEIEDAKL